MLSPCGVNSKNFFMPPRQSFRFKIFKMRTKAEVQNNTRNHLIYKPNEFKLEYTRFAMSPASIVLSILLAVHGGVEMGNLNSLYY